MSFGHPERVLIARRARRQTVDSARRQEDGFGHADSFLVIQQIGVFARAEARVLVNIDYRVLGWLDPPGLRTERGGAGGQKAGREKVPAGPAPGAARFVRADVSNSPGYGHFR
jgi:hypothetical protein